MVSARLTAIGLCNFKSFGPAQHKVELAPLTVLVGRNNSGKSSIIQSVMLLKQTLTHRSNEELHLEGPVDALSLRELTHGWPQQKDIEHEGPTITLTWESMVNVDAALASGRRPLDRTKFVRETKLEWIASSPSKVRLRTEMSVQFWDSASRICVGLIELSSWRIDGDEAAPDLRVTMQRPIFGSDRSLAVLLWNDEDRSDKLFVELDHFLPHISALRGAPASSVAKARAFRVLFEQPLEALKNLLLGFNYIGSTRVIPPSIYRPTSSPPDDVGFSGEYAAHLLHARRKENVHFLPLLRLSTGGIQFELPGTIRSLPLVDAVNAIFSELGINNSFRLEDVRDVGFRLLFGQASLQHVGRGVGHLLPVIVAGLSADPVRDEFMAASVPLKDYLQKCDILAHLAIEEPETHLHPKVQTLLAHFLVSLAMSGRQIVVETHSDHLVRRLRSLIAHAAPGSSAERWLKDNIAIVEVDQDEHGLTHLRQSALTTEGSIAEHWPADFMDEAPIEERSIYYAALDKHPAPDEAPYATGTEFIEGKDSEEGD